MRQNQKLLHSPYNKLKGFMREKEIVYSEMANLIGVTPTTISQKINGQSDFSLSEAELIKKLTELVMIFFSPKVAKTQRTYVRIIVRWAMGVQWYEVK